MPEFDSYETVKQRMQYFFSNIQPVEKQENTSKKKHRSVAPAAPVILFPQSDNHKRHGKSQSGLSVPDR